MKYVGVDLHKHVIKLCVIMVLQGKRKVVSRRSFQCSDTHSIRVFFEGLGPFQVVVEATSAYEWFFLLIEDLADRLVLAHPKKLRVIAESTRKTDKIDAEVLATFLALDMIPEAYRPSPRVQQYRVLVRHRHWIQGRITAVKCKLRNKAAHYNADIAELFQQRGQQHLADLAMNAADRFQTDAMLQHLSFLESGLQEAERQLRTFADSVRRGGAGGTGRVGQYSPDWPHNDQRGAERTGRLETIRFGQGGGGLRRLGSGRTAIGRETTGYAHQQGRFANPALGLDRSRLAIGGPSAAMAMPLRAVACQHRLEEKGDCRRGSAPVVHDVCHAPKGSGLSLCGVMEKGEFLGGSLGEGPEAPVPSPKPPPPSLFPVVPEKESSKIQRILSKCVDFAVTPMPCLRRL